MTKERECQFAEAGPIWLEALIASGCRAISDRRCHPVSWTLDRQAASYTNAGALPEVIDPLNVTLAAGESLFVTWDEEATDFKLRVRRKRSARNGSIAAAGGV